MTLDAAEALVSDLSYSRGDVRTLLERSAGTHNGTPVYRPRAVAAMLWHEAKNTQKLSEAEGAKFGSVRQTIRGLLDTQELMDATDVGLVIPTAWSVPVLRRQFGAGNSVFVAGF